MSLREKVKQVRLATGLTAADFAKSIDYSKSQITKVEAGFEEPSQKMIGKIKITYGVSDGFFDGTERLEISTDSKQKKIETTGYAERLIKALEDQVRKWEQEAMDWKKVAINLSSGKFKAPAQSGVFTMKDARARAAA